MSLSRGESSTQNERTSRKSKYYLHVLALRPLSDSPLSLFLLLHLFLVPLSTCRAAASSTAFPKVFQKMRPSCMVSNSLTSNTASSADTGSVKGSEVT